MAPHKHKFENYTHRTAGDYASTHPLLSWKKSDSIHTVIADMRKHHIFAGVVTSNDKLEGLVTEHTIISCLSSWMDEPITTVERLTRAFNTFTVADIMIPNPICININDSLEHAFLTILNYGFRAMPVVTDNQEPIGIIERESLLQYIQGQERKELEEKDMMLSYLLNSENYGCV